MPAAPQAASARALIDLPKVELPHQPRLTADRVADVLRQRMPELQVKPTKFPGVALIASKNAALGASLRIKHQPKKERTLIVVGGIVPNLGLRVAFVLVFVVPLLILDLVAHLGVAAQIAEALGQAPELQDGGAPSAMAGQPERP